MTYEEKSEIVIRQLREDRDRLLDAIDKIRAEIKTKSGDIETIADVLQIIDKYREERGSMYEESIEELNKWFDDKKRSYFTGYNEYGEYTVSPSDVYDFCEYLREHEPDLIGIRVLIKESIHFTREDLENADYYY